MWLTRFSLNRPIIVAMLFVGLAVYGIMSFFSLGASLNPNVAFPVVVVEANYPGASPAEMERLVIKPIEDQIDGIDNLDRMSATAQEGTAEVVVQFKLDTNLDYAAIDVQRRVDTARVYMPTDLDPPVVIKNGSDSPLIEMAISSKSLSATELSDLVHDRIVPEIKHIPNVATVDVYGELDREFHVMPDRERMAAVDLTLPDLFDALANNNSNLPGGRFDSPSSETSVSVHADINSASDLALIPLANALDPFTGIATKGLRLGDVAKVEDGHVEQRRPSHYNGHPAFLIDINRVITADEIGSTKIAREEIAKIRAEYPQVTFAEVDVSADYTQASLNGVMQSLLEGIALTAIVMLLFLHAWRSATVVMIAIPVSLLATFIVMRVLGFTLDIVSLMGLSLTIGILVDDSIVILENITRHRDMGESPMDAALSGRAEIGGAAVAITLVDVVVFLPIAFLAGFVGKYMREFGIVVVVATLFSLLVSFTLTPMLAALWAVKKRSVAPPRILAGFQRGFDSLTRWYHEAALPLAMRHGWATGGICLLLLLSPIVPFAMGAIQSEFVPADQTGIINMTVTYPTGTALAVTAHGVDDLESAIAQVPGIRGVLSTVGRKPSGWSVTVGGNVARLTALMDEKRRGESNRAIADIRRLEYLVPGAKLTVAGETGGGSGSQIFYTLSGPEGELSGAAEKLAAFIRAIPGTVNVQTGAESAAPRINVYIDPHRAETLGVSPGTAAEAARLAVGGAVATRVRTETRLVDVRIQSPLSQRSTLADLQKVEVRAADGTLIPLARVASFTQTEAPTKIERLDRQRVTRVTGDIDDSITKLGPVVDKIDAMVKQPGFLPSGVSIRASGDSQFFAETLSSMGIALVTSFALVYMLMVILYGNFLTPAVIMFSVPVAAVGALWGLALTGQTINLFSMIGMIMLFGLVAKNGILLVDYANTLRKRGLRVREAMQAAAGTRFRPILMTTCAMVFGMLPLALGLAEGAGFRRSMGVVLIGGLISSLILTLFLVPVVYAALMGFGERRADKRAMREEMAAPRAVPTS